MTDCWSKETRTCGHTWRSRRANSNICFCRIWINWALLRRQAHLISLEMTAMQPFNGVKAFRVTNRFKNWFRNLLERGALQMCVRTVGTTSKGMEATLSSQAGKMWASAVHFSTSEAKKTVRIARLRQNRKILPSNGRRLWPSTPMMKARRPTTESCPRKTSMIRNRSSSWSSIRTEC